MTATSKVTAGLEHLVLASEQLAAEAQRLRSERDEALSALDGENSELADHLRAQWEA